MCWLCKTPACHEWKSPSTVHRHVSMLALRYRDHSYRRARRLHLRVAGWQVRPGLGNAQISGRYAVLDIATGPGEPALSIANLLGPEGKVVGTDAVPKMVEAARREGRRRRLHNFSVEVAFADSLPFPANSFDAVMSRLWRDVFPFSHFRHPFGAADRGTKT